ncbi:penicillin-binding protein 1C [Thiocapsa roseopersicina]|uniref:peptidoglycan glycosyltransferase n=1 Tax=Thiocapsa roseopersicina TaxID=1058 RepID=A0A1H2TWR3_THIRO|nr:penicillin-binding protein 1C [Thiocapsa roseopersicina]SDW48322.1 penicillin-binding protein 1C [Thiocapsa roseopersicina]
MSLVLSVNGALIKSLAAVGAVLFLLAGGRAGLDAFIETTPPLDMGIPTSTLMLDRDGRLLRAFTVADGRWRLPVDLDAVDPAYIAMLLAYEDRRFASHPGVDALALMRAGWQLLSQGGIRSGGSTLTMQLARLLEMRSTRDAGGKLSQIRTALWLERRLDKDAILQTYLTLAPYGGNLEGVRSASLAWLGKEPRRLSPAEAALLVALPQSPETRRPDRYPEAARRARDRVLEHVRLAGVIDADEAAAARAEPVPTTRLNASMLAAHLTDRLRRARPERAVHRLTLDAGLQERLEQLANARAAALGPRVSMGILVADHGRGEILASVGSAGLFETARQGHVDMTRAVRSPGSALKPLIYGLAFEDGRAHPESLIEDRPSAFGGYVPANFDLGFQGTVTVRRALQLSLNIPAVKLLDAVGPARLVARMRRAGARPELPDLSPPGLAVGLGGVGVSLTDLVGIYASIARGGRPVSLRDTLDDDGADFESLGVVGIGADAGAPVLEARAAWYVASILAGAPAPTNSAPGVLAFKTGTSYGYRDAWAIGFDGRHVAGVWVGRPDGTPVPGLAGIDAAAPVLVEVFSRLGPTTPLPPAPPGILTTTSAELPPPLRRVQDPRAASGGQSLGGAQAPQIAYPPEGARVELGLGRGRAADLVLRVRDGVPPFTWFVDGAPVLREPYARTARWTPDGPGYVAISVVDARGGAARVSVFLE